MKNYSVESTILLFIFVAWALVFSNRPYEGTCIAARREYLMVKSVKVSGSSISYHVNVKFYRNKASNITCKYTSLSVPTKSKANEEASKFSVGEYHSIYVSKEDKSICQIPSLSHGLFTAGLVMILIVACCCSIWLIVLFSGICCPCIEFFVRKNLEPTANSNEIIAEVTISPPNDIEEQITYVEVDIQREESNEQEIDTSGVEDVNTSNNAYASKNVANEIISREIFCDCRLQ
jgi:hypothetical protein